MIKCFVWEPGKWLVFDGDVVAGKFLVQEDIDRMRAQRNDYATIIATMEAKYYAMKAALENISEQMGEEGERIYRSSDDAKVVATWRTMMEEIDATLAMVEAAS